MLTFPWLRYKNGFAVYQHQLIADPLLPADAWDLIYIGVCRIRDVGVWPDAQSNSEWIERMALDATCVLHVTILDTFDTQTAAINYRAAMLAQMTRKPVCNVRGVLQHGARTPIICNETKARYESATEAARMLGVTQSMMSQHLSRKQGFKTVRGLTFRRAQPGEAL